MQLKQIMSRDVEVIGPESTICDAGQIMRDLDIGALPVCDGERLVGMITDRDITIRAVADGCDPKDTLVGDCMSPEVVYCFEDQDTEEAERLMEEKQIRRVLVLSRQKRLTGIVALADIATKTNEAETARAARSVSQKPTVSF